ncbi:MAG: transposase [Gammaproteobacteria bacterium]|nr:transposase [Gammaproteobacteria bacterium]
MQHRIREAFADVAVTFDGPVEVDEAYFGGLRKNMSNTKRAELKRQGLGRGPKGKQAVVAAKDRETRQVVARVIE